MQFGQYIASALSQRGLELQGRKLGLDAPILNLTLFLGYLLTDDDAALAQEMAKWGPLVRCFVMRNKEGMSKVGAVVSWRLLAWVLGLGLVLRGWRQLNTALASLKGSNMQGWAIQCTYGL